MRPIARLCILAATMAVACHWATGAQEAPKANLDIKATIIRIADRWVETWIDSQWDEAKGIYMWRHGPYSDAFEHHYVAAVLINTPGSKFHRSETLSRRVTSDLIYHSRIFVEQFRDKGLRGYWALNGASDKGVPVGSGSWQSRSYLRACMLLDARMKPDEQQAWREGAKWLIAALTVDWTENYGPWWSTNKISDHVAFVALWLHLTQDPQARQFLDRQFDWYWAAFAPQGMADKYHNYFAKTLYRLAAILFAPEASRYHAPLLERARMFRSFVTDNGLFDAALHDEPNSEQSWHAKLGPVLALLLVASPQEPDLAIVAQNIVNERLADCESDAFWKRQFDLYFDGHWGSLGLIIESAPQWEPVLAQVRPNRPASFAQMRFFDYWQGLGRVAVKTSTYQASCYPHWAWTWDFARLGGTLHRLTTPGTFRFPESGKVAARTDSARCWLDWDPHKNVETGGERTSLVVARAGAETFSTPPYFPDEAIVSGSPEGRLYGFTHCRYRLGPALEVRTSNAFLDDMVIVLNTVTALEDAAFDALYIEESLANPGDLEAVTADGQTIQFDPANVRPKASVPHPVNGPVDLRSKDGTGALGFVPLANAFVKQELVDIALFRDLKGDSKQAPHRVESWRGHLPLQMKKGDVLVADFAYVPHAADAAFKPVFQVIRTEKAHGVIVPGEPSIIVGQALRSGEASAWTIGDCRATGQFFAAEVAAGAPRKVSLYGTSLAWRDKPALSLSREAAATVLTQTGEGTVDTGVGPIAVTTAKETRRVFAANHEFPRMASTSLSLTAAAEGPGAAPADVAAVCRRFTTLPDRIEIAARLAELEILVRLADARGKKADRAAALEAEAKQALAAGDIGRARKVAAEIQKEVLAAHSSADQAQKAVAALGGSDAPAQPQAARTERVPDNYRISLVEEKGRQAVIRRAEMLCRALAARPDGEKLCAEVCGAEQTLLTRYYGLPIRWTREHIPGQPVFFWLPVLAGNPKGEAVTTDEWTGTLLKYVHQNNRLGLATARLEAAAREIGD